jgi:uncharacterized cupin superfamily protein
MNRPEFLRTTSELPLDGDGKGWRYGGDDEWMAPYRAISRPLGLARVGVHEVIVNPGQRTSWPHAEEKEEEMAIVLSGSPDLWVDGWLHRLRPGDVAVFVPGTGITHTVLNDEDEPARLLSIGEKRPDNRWYYPFRPQGYAGMTEAQSWTDAPKRPMGPHDGRPARLRGTPATHADRGVDRPAWLRNWSELASKRSGYPGEIELMCEGTALSRPLGLSRLGVHLENLTPGTRTCWPHCEEKEEEFAFVLDGVCDAWIDGRLHPMRAGDAIAFVPGTGIAHALLNDGEGPARLIVVGENHDDNRTWYSFAPEGWRGMPAEGVWRDRPVRELGPHDGLPAAVRAAAAKGGDQ